MKYRKKVILFNGSGYQIISDYISRRYGSSNQSKKEIIKKLQKKLDTFKSLRDRKIIKRKRLKKKRKMCIF